MQPSPLTDLLPARIQQAWPVSGLHGQTSQSEHHSPETPAVLQHPGTHDPSDSILQHLGTDNPSCGVAGLAQVHQRVREEHRPQPPGVLRHPRLLRLLHSRPVSPATCLDNGVPAWHSLDYTLHTSALTRHPACSLCHPVSPHISRRCQPATCADGPEAFVCMDTKHPAAVLVFREAVCCLGRPSRHHAWQQSPSSVSTDTCVPVNHL